MSVSDRFGLGDLDLGSENTPTFKSLMISFGVFDAMCFCAELYLTQKKENAEKNSEKKLQPVLPVKTPLQNIIPKGTIMYIHSQSGTQEVIHFNEKNHSQDSHLRKTLTP